MRSDRMLCLQEKPVPAGEVCCYHQNTLHQLRLAQGRQAGSHLEAEVVSLKNSREKRYRRGGCPQTVLQLHVLKSVTWDPSHCLKHNKFITAIAVTPLFWSLPQVPFSIHRPLSSAHLGRFATISPHPVLLLPLSPRMIHNN